MSETELHLGRVSKIQVIGDTFEEQVRYLETMKDIKFEDLDLKNRYFYSSEPLVHYHEKSNTWWVVEDKETDFDSLFKTYKRLDGSADYVFSFYNGGASLSELLDEVVDEVIRE